MAENTNSAPNSDGNPNGTVADVPDHLRGFLSIDQAVEAQMRTHAEGNPAEPDTAPATEPEQPSDAHVVDADLATQPTQPEADQEPTLPGLAELVAEPEPPSEPEPAVPQVLFEHDGRPVTLEEAQRGFMLQADYTRKTQAVAEERKRIQAEEQRLSNERQHYTKALETLKTSLTQQQSAGMSDAEMEVLRQQDPMAWMQQKELMRENESRLAKLEQEQDRVAREEAEARQSQLTRYIQEQQEQLAVVMPEWKDEKVANERRSAMRDYLKDYGFSDQEMSQIYDHRLLIILNDALRGKMAADPAALEKKRVTNKTPSMPKTARQPAAAPADARVRQLAKKFEQSGSIEDAVDFQLARAEAAARNV